MVLLTSRPPCWEGFAEGTAVTATGEFGGGWGRQSPWRPRRARPRPVPVERRQRVEVAGRVVRVGNDAEDGALERRALQQPAPHQLHVPRRVHAGAHGGARQQHGFGRQQQRQAGRDLDGAARGRHG